MAWILKNLPLPPSDNQLRASVRGRLIKTKIARTFSKDITTWALKSAHSLSEARKTIPKDKPLKVHFKIHLRADRLFTKSKHAKSPFKRLDASNRVKALQDAISQLIDIDDSHFFLTSVEKIPSKMEYVEVVISEMEVVYES